jgi:MFS transporter, MHS family, proline/betaine transporter
MLLRRWLSETPVFREMHRRAPVNGAVPLRVVLRSHKRAVLVSILCTWMLTAAILVVVLMTPTLLQTLFQVSLRQALVANFAATVAQCVAIVAVGAAADRFGIRRVAVPILLLLTVGTYGVYLAAERAPHALVMAYVLAGIGAGGAVLTPLVMVRAFPAAIRFAGVSFSYNVGYAIFGGITPLLVSAMAHWSRFVPAHYVAAVALVGLIAILRAPETGAE